MVVVLRRRCPRIVEPARPRRGERVIEIPVPTDVLWGADVIRELQPVHSSVLKVDSGVETDFASWNQKPDIDLVLDLLVIVGQLDRLIAADLVLDPEVELIDDGRFQRLTKDGPFRERRGIEQPVVRSPDNRFVAKTVAQVYSRANRESING